MQALYKQRLTKFSRKKGWKREEKELLIEISPKNLDTFITNVNITDVNNNKKKTSYTIITNAIS